MQDAKPSFGPSVHVTKNFANCWEKLSLSQQILSQRKIAFLLENPHYPSLRCHPLGRSGKQLWSCSLSKTERLIYSRQGRRLIFHAIGSHGEVDKYHTHHFSVQKKHEH